MGDGENEYIVKLTQIERYNFRVDFGLPGVGPLTGDEDPPLGKNAGPDPSRMLAASVAQCTLSSLLFCMEKSRANVDGLSATAKVRFGRNEEKRLRITGIDLIVDAHVPEEEKHKIERCLPIFQDFCTVTQSVKSGIPVSVDLRVNEKE